MVLFLVLVAGLAALLGRSLVNAFMGNPAVNGVILGILIAGIVYIFRQVLSLDPELRWIEGFRNHESGGGDSAAGEPAPRLLGSMARMLGGAAGPASQPIGDFVAGACSTGSRRGSMKRARPRAT